MHLVYESSSAFRRLSSTLSSSLTMCNWVIEKGSDQSPLVLVWTDDYDILGLDFFFFLLDLSSRTGTAETRDGAERPPVAHCTRPGCSGGDQHIRSYLGTDRKPCNAESKEERDLVRHPTRCLGGPERRLRFQHANPPPPYMCWFHKPKISL
jgi:hypothetical protein